MWNWETTRTLLTDWTASQIAWSFALVAAMLIGSAVASGMLVIYLPSTYFSCSRPVGSKQRTLFDWVLLIARNLLGALLIVAGIVMLVLPGQGLMTILIGLLFLSFSGKRKFVSVLIQRAGLLDTINRWRAKFGKPPLEMQPTK